MVGSLGRTTPTGELPHKHSSACDLLCIHLRSALLETMMEVNDNCMVMSFSYHLLNQSMVMITMREYHRSSE